MTELPDLPPVPRVHRPLPPGGAEAAMARGARRRNRMLASAGGATTALALVLVATVSLPGGGDDSLGIAEPPDREPVVSPSPEDVGPTAAVEVPLPPGEVPEPSSSPATGAPDTAATRESERVAPGDSAPAPLRSSVAPPASAATSQPSAQPPAATSRPAYREDTDENAAGSAECAPGQAAGSGMDMAGTSWASGCSYGANSGRVARRNDQVYVSYGECSSRGTSDTIYTFGGGQEKDLVVTRDGQEVFRFSSTVRYVEGAHQRRLRGGRCIEWTGRWNLVDTTGRPVPAGTYQVTLTVEADRVEPEGAPDLAEPYRQTSSLEVTVLD